jgi:hypothetical protein
MAPFGVDRGGLPLIKQGVPPSDGKTCLPELIENKAWKISFNKSVRSY